MTPSTLHYVKIYFMTRVWLILYLYQYWYKAVTTAGVMCGLWHLKLSTELAHAALSSRAFQSWIVFTKNEFIYCWVLGCLVLKQFEWFMQMFAFPVESVTRLPFCFDRWNTYIVLFFRFHIVPEGFWVFIIKSFLYGTINMIPFCPR